MLRRVCCVEAIRVSTRASDAEGERESLTNLKRAVILPRLREKRYKARALAANTVALSPRPTQARRSRRTSRRERTRRYEMFGPRSGHSLGTEIETWRTSTWMT